MTTILDGKAFVAEQEKMLQGRVQRLQERGVIPTLAVIQVTGDAASDVYIRHKKRAGERIGILVEHYVFPQNTPELALIEQIQKLNMDTAIHGIIVQLPLPEHHNASIILNTITPKKDVDGITDISLGALVSQSTTTLQPCTPSGIIALLKHYNIPIAGQNITIIGRSRIVGRPLFIMLMNLNATVTVCHRNTRDITRHTLLADIVIPAVGAPRFLTKDMVQQGAVVVDVGINRTENGLMGDADFDTLLGHASYITPVPGGIGPTTVYMLLQNTVFAAEQQTQ